MTKQIQKKVNVASNAVHTHSQANEWAEKFSLSIDVDL